MSFLLPVSSPGRRTVAPTQLALLLLFALAGGAPADAPQVPAPPSTEELLARLPPDATDRLCGELEPDDTGSRLERRAGERDAFAFYVAGPADARRHVVLFHTAFGLDARNRALAERLGALGWRVWAIDLFDGRTTGSLVRGYFLLREANNDAARTRARIAAALDWLAGRVGADEPVVVLGASFGARWAFEALALRPAFLDGAALFYPYPIEELAPLAARLPEPAPPLLVVLAREDEHVPLADATAWVEALRAAGVSVEALTLPGGHAFTYAGLDNHAPESERAAWRAALAFLVWTTMGARPAPESVAAGASGDAGGEGPAGDAGATAVPSSSVSPPR